MVKTSLYPALACAAISLALTGCGDLERINNSDPKVTGGGTLRELLVGSWSRDDGEKNEVYVFRADGRVELRQFFSDDEEVNRDAPFPQTLEHDFAGIYTLVIDVLTISFTSAVSFDPDETIVPPPRDIVVEIGIRGRTLTLNERDGKRLYTRLD